MCKIIGILIIYICVEIIANIVFFFPMKKIYGSKKQIHEKALPWMKGVLERVCLNVGMLLGFPQILIAFGALKIGTKINNESLNSEYYLLGNLASILTCFIFIYCCKSEIITNKIFQFFGCG